MSEGHLERRPADSALPPEPPEEEFPRIFDPARTREEESLPDKVTAEQLRQFMIDANTQSPFPNQAHLERLLKLPFQEQLQYLAMRGVGNTRGADKILPPDWQMTGYPETKT